MYELFDCCACCDHSRLIRPAFHEHEVPCVLHQPILFDGSFDDEKEAGEMVKKPLLPSGLETMEFEAFWVNASALQKRLFVESNTASEQIRIMEEASK